MCVCVSHTHANNLPQSRLDLSHGAAALEITPHAWQRTPSTPTPAHLHMKTLPPFLCLFFRWKWEPCRERSGKVGVGRGASIWNNVHSSLMSALCVWSPSFSHTHTFIWHISYHHPHLLLVLMTSVQELLLKWTPSSVCRSWCHPDWDSNQLRNGGCRGKVIYCTSSHTYRWL